MTAITISGETFEREVLQSAEPVLVDFYAEYCRPCKAMEPILHEAAKDLQGQVKIAKLDVEKNLDMAEKYAVRGMPTLLLFKDGKPLARHVGAIMQKAKLAAWIGSFVAESGSSASPRTTVFRLSNGMDVVVIASKSAPDVAHVIYYKAGAADAHQGGSGVANILCSLMSNSAEALAAKVRSHSTHDSTYYEWRTSSDLLLAVMQSSADDMATFRFTEQEVEAARQLAMERFSPRAENNGWRLHQEMNSALFGSHLYAIPEEGLEEELAELSHEGVAQFHRRYYAPNNAVLVVSGDVTPDEIRELAEATYGKVPANPDVAERARPALALIEAPRRFSTNVPSSRGTWFNRKYLAPSYVTAQAREAEALDLIVQVLSRNTGVLHRRMVTEEKLATYASASYSGQSLGLGSFALSAQLVDGDIERVEAIVDEVIEELRTRGPTQAEVDSAREALMIRYSGVSQDGNGLASRYGEALALGRTIAQVDGWPDAIAKVTIEDMKNVAGAYLDPRRGVTGWLLVDASGADGAGDVVSTAR